MVSKVHYSENNPDLVPCFLRMTHTFDPQLHLSSFGQKEAHNCNPFKVDDFISVFVPRDESFLSEVDVTEECENKLKN